MVRPWLVTVTPVYLLASVALYAHPVVLSRALFGAVPDAREVAATLPRLFLAQIVPVLADEINRAPAKTQAAVNRYLDVKRSGLL